MRFCHILHFAFQMNLAPNKSTMKKHFLLPAVCATALLAASCSNDDIPQMSDNGLTTFTVELPATLSSRSFGDGQTANYLFAAIYGSDGQLLFSNFGDGKNADSMTIVNFNDAAKPMASLTVPLVKDADYQVVFWAQSYANKDTGSPYEFDPDTRSITVDYSKIDVNTDDADAFYGQLSFKSSGASHPVTLKRPFGQLNIGTDDLKAAANAGMTVTQAGVTVTGVANTLNLFNGNITSSEDFSSTQTFAMQNLPGTAPQPAEVFPVSGTPAYDYLTMGYFLVGENTATKGLLDSVQLFVNGRTSTDKFAQYDNIPMQGNFRTNIYGSLLTNSEQFTVTINPAFGTPDIDPMWKGNTEIALDGNTVIFVSQNIKEGLTVSGTGILEFNSSSIAPTADGTPAITLADGANVTIMLSGNNTFTGSKGADAIRVPAGATLTLTGDNITAIGNNRKEYSTVNAAYCNTTDQSYNEIGGSGIGNLNADTGNIIIDNVKGLTAQGYGKHAFGIGGQNAAVTIKNNTVINNARGGYASAKLYTGYGKGDPEGGAAIGVSGSTGSVTIENSQVLAAHGGSKAAAIGASYWSSATISISGSTLKNIVGGNASAAIGGSRFASDGTYTLDINIVDSEINATGGEYGSGIGSGYDVDCKKRPAENVKINISGNSVIVAKGGDNGAGIGTGYHCNTLTGSIAESVDVTGVQAGFLEKIKAGYTINQAIGYGVLDPGREGLDLDPTFTVAGKVIAAPEVQK